MVSAGIAKDVEARVVDALLLDGDGSCLQMALVRLVLLVLLTSSFCETRVLFIYIQETLKMSRCICSIGM